MGFPQTAQVSVVRSPRCLEQNWELTGIAGAGAAGFSGNTTRIRTVCEGGDASRGAGASDNGGGAAGAANSSRTSWLTISEESCPQAGQTKLTGCDAISGVMSKAYFAPQEHWIFMGHSGFGIQ
jgi:hypothetical protein